MLFLFASENAEGNRAHADRSPMISGGEYAWRIGDRDKAGTAVGARCEKHGAGASR
jgi:hypothetical protein